MPKANAFKKYLANGAMKVFTNRADPEVFLGGKAKHLEREAHATEPAPDEALMLAEERGFHDRGNPLEGFVDPQDRLSLAADELAVLFHWLLLGGEKKSGPRPAAARDMSGHQLSKALQRPKIIACRFLAMLLHMRPDLLDGMQAKQVARKLRISPRMMAFYTMNFGEHFPAACKAIRRNSRVLTAQIKAARHQP